MEQGLTILDNLFWSVSKKAKSESISRGGDSRLSPHSSHGKGRKNFTRLRLLLWYIFHAYRTRKQRRKFLFTLCCFFFYQQRQRSCMCAHYTLISFSVREKKYFPWKGGKRKKYEILISLACFLRRYFSNVTFSPSVISLWFQMFHK